MQREAKENSNLSISKYGLGKLSNMVYAVHGGLEDWACLKISLILNYCLDGAAWENEINN